MDNKELEQMMRSTFKGAKTQPPAGLWDEIARHDLTPKGIYREGRERRRRQIIAAVASLIVLSGIATFFILRNQKSHDSGFVYGAIKPAQNGDDIALLTNDTLTIDSEETVIEHEQEAPAKETEKREKKATEKAEPLMEAAQPQPTKTEQTAEPAKSPEPSPIVRPEEKAKEKTSPKPTPTTTKPASTTPKPAAEKPSALAHSESSQKEPAPAQQQPQAPQKPTWDVPNSITPNGDGQNDYFYIRNLEEYSPVAMSVYTAQGKRVYFTSDYNNDFDGGDLPAGNYFVVLQIKQGPCAGHVRRGVLVIKR